MGMVRQDSDSWNYESARITVMAVIIGASEQFGRMKNFVQKIR
jgi:hypothetical protein